jgi:hypothetical protein
MRVFLLLTVAMLVSVGSLRADSFVQWGAEKTDDAVSHDGLAWKKPTTSSGVVTANRVPQVANPIRLVQYQEPAFPLPTPPTPAQQDTVYPEKRPQTTTPPSGATIEPLFTPAAPLPMPTLPPPQPEPLRTPSSTEPAPATGPTPAPSPLDANTPPPQRKGVVDCPDTAAFKSIREISYDIRPMPGELPKECPLIAPPYSGRFYGRTCYFWNASALCTKGAYFENVQLERYGHSLCPVLEPIISGVRFFVTVPFLPYKMGLTPPNECVYTLGHYRVGSCAPYMLDPLPISVRAVLFEAAAVGGAVAIIP